MAVQKGEGRYEMLSQTWSITGRSDEFDAWISRPDHVGRFPGLVIVPDVSGVTPFVREFARTLSRMGYAAITPDPFYRLGGVKQDATGEQYREVAALVGDGRMVADIQDTVKYLHSFPSGVDANRLGAIGFGDGARLAQAVAGDVVTIRRVVDLQCMVHVHPTLGEVSYAGETRKRTVTNQLPRSAEPVLALFAGEDEAATDDEVADYRDELGDRGTIVTYKNAKRGFLDQQSGVYDVATAQDAIGRIIGFLDSRLGEGKPV